MQSLLITFLFWHLTQKLTFILTGGYAFVDPYTRGRRGSFQTPQLVQVTTL